MPAALALPAIQTAIVAKLKGDATVIAALVVPTIRPNGADGVYNTAPALAPFRFLTVGKGTEQSEHTMGPDNQPKWGANCTVEIAARGQDSSDLPLLQLASRIVTLFDGQLLTVVGYPSVVVSVESVPAIFDELVDNRETRTQPLILRVIVHEGTR